MIQIDPASLKQSLHLRETATSAIDSILARVILERCTRHDQIGIRDDLIRVWAGLQHKTKHGKC